MNKFIKIFYKKVFNIFILTRMNQPIGFFLLLWPTLWSLWTANESIPEKKILLIFISEVLLTRSIGCIINDYIDRKIDSLVFRTRNRPIPNNTFSKKNIILILLFFLSLSFILILFLKKNTIFLSSFVLPLIFIYPFSKRYTNFPQLFLGITFSFSILISFMEVNSNIPKIGWLLFLANTFWTTAYDTQYSLMDKEEDIKIGVKSTSIYFKNSVNRFIFLMQTLTIVFLILIGLDKKFGWMFYFFSITMPSILFIFQNNLIKKKKYYKAFLNNNYVGMYIFVGIFLEFL